MKPWVGLELHIACGLSWTDTQFKRETHLSGRVGQYCQPCPFHLLIIPGTVGLMEQ